MNIASLNSPRRRGLSNSGPVRPADLSMYAAILGKPVVTETPVPADPPRTAANLPALQSLARRAWARGVGQITERLRAIWGVGAAAAKQPQVAGWLRHLSEEAYKRFDQAQMRLTTSHDTYNRRRVESREVMSIHPVEREYKRVA